MQQFQPPEPLSFDGNLAENWRRWKQRFEIYMTASGRDAKPDTVKSATFLHVAGPEALEVFNTLTFDNEDDQKKLSVLMEKFEEYCTPRRNVTWERHVFNTRRQQPGETIDQYVTDLKKKAKSCEFGDLNDSLIKDRVVCGILSDKTRARLLKQPDLTLAKAIDMCRADETTLTHMKSMGATNTSKPETQPVSDEDLDVKALKNKRIHPCGRCGNQHDRQQTCPASGATCHNCGRHNHYARVCRSKPRQPTHPRVKELDYEELSEEELIIAAIGQQDQGDWDVTVCVNFHNINH